MRFIKFTTLALTLACLAGVVVAWPAAAAPSSTPDEDVWVTRKELR